MDKYLKQWREDTPGCAYRIHLNNAGAAFMPAPVISAINDHLDKEVHFGGYEAADTAAREITTCYESVGQLIGASASNIAIVENATVATSQALSAFDFQPGDTIITTNVDYSSNQIMLLNLAKRLGIEIIRASDLPEGGVDSKSIRLLIQKNRPKLVLMSWVPTNSGLIQDAHAVGRVCNQEKIPYLLDACQAVGQLPIDVSKLNCDFLFATARKFLRGPRGLGFLYVSDKMLERNMYPLFPDTKGARWISANDFEVEPDAKRFENWEFPYALVVGLGAAAKYAGSVGIEIAGKRACGLAAHIREKLMQLSNIRVLDRGKHRCAIVTVEVKGIDSKKLMEKLRREKINTSVIMRNQGVIDMDAKEVKSALRISPHYYNTIEEVEQTIEVLQAV